MVPLKYLSDFWSTLKMPLINCETKLIRTWSEKCVVASNTAANQATTLAIIVTKLYVSVVTLSIDDNAKYYSNWNQILEEQLTGTNINYK